MVDGLAPALGAGGLQVQVPTAELVALLLASVRAAAFLVVAPPFSSRGIPGTVKAMLAVALALPLAPRLADTAPTSTAGLVTAAVLQVVAGVGLGLLCQVLVSAVQAAGDLLDLAGGFVVSSVYDPLMLTQSAVLGRFFQMTALALLFATNGHLVVLHGFMRTYELLPLDGRLDLAALGGSLTEAVAQLVLTAVQVAGPLLVVLFLADVGLGLLTRIAPALNPFALGFPLKVLVTLLLVGAGTAALPEVVRALAESAAAATTGTASAGSR